jgi:hypothetical protein
VDPVLHLSHCIDLLHAAVTSFREYPETQILASLVQDSADECYLMFPSAARVRVRRVAAK